MDEEAPADLEEYYREAATWSEDRQSAQRRSERRSWLVAGAATAVALLEAIAIIVMTPLKTVVPYTLLVDRQTGYVQALKPLDREAIAPDAALTRSFLAQYVIAREGFDVDSLRDDYRKVALWSAGEARNRYVADMQASNPRSPLATLPRRALVEVQLRSISSLAADTALVRFSTTRVEGATASNPRGDWAAVIKYRFSNAAMSTSDRLLNPLGFQVDRYARNPETLPEVQPAGGPRTTDPDPVPSPMPAGRLPPRATQGRQ